jgi:hypothetical protein
MNKNIWIALLGILGAGLLTVPSCLPPEDVEKDDVLLAKVYNKPLYLSELEGMVPNNVSDGDSTLIVNSYVERWVRENLMLYEAERNLPKDLNIDKLVRDYRSSLILHNYEKELVETQLDSVITDAEVMEYYKKYETLFQGKANILRCQFMKIPKAAPDLAKAEKWWDDAASDASMRLLEEYCGEYAVVYQLDGEMWLNSDEVAAEFPKGALSSIKEGKESKLSEGDYRYFFRVIETQSDDNEPPIEYVRAEVSKFILHNRKLKLVEKHREEVYKKAERKGNVKYF